MQKPKKKIVFLAGAACLVIAIYPYKHIYHPSYEILDDGNDAFARYSNGLVYIGDEKYLNSLKSVKNTDILVLDERNLKDANICIYNSCSITSKEVRNEVLEIICHYENMYPTKWDRSIESMRLEWFCHNVGYYFNYKQDHTKEVDLNNKDEEKYNNEFVRRMLRL